MKTSGKAGYVEVIHKETLEYPVCICISKCWYVVGSGVVVPEEVGIAFPSDPGYIISLSVQF